MKSTLNMLSTCRRVSPLQIAQWTRSLRVASRTQAAVATPILRPNEKAALKNSVGVVLHDDGVFKHEISNKEIDYFFDSLGLNDLYFMSFPAARIANHVSAYIAAKRNSLIGAADLDDFFYRLESKDKQEGAFFMCADTKEHRLQCERHVEEYIKREDAPEWSYSLKMFRSANPGKAGGSVHLMLYFVTWSQWNDPNLKPAAEELSDTPIQLSKVASQQFLTEKVKPIQERYTQVLDDFRTKLTPVVRVYETGDSTTFAVMMLFPKRDKSYLEELTQITSKLGVTTPRRFVETFKLVPSAREAHQNEVQGYQASTSVETITIYTTGMTKEEIFKKLVPEITALSLLPLDKEFRELYFSGGFTTQSLLYARAIITFVYYFAKTKIPVDDYQALRAKLVADPVKVASLDRLFTGGSRPSLTEASIIHCIQTHPALFQECFEDFSKSILNPEQQEPNPELLRKIAKVVGDDQERLIFSSMVVFNSAVLKTNFNIFKKTAVSYRLDPQLLEKHMGFPFHHVPHAVIMLTGEQFTGFHIRFEDIARGGIRLIISKSAEQYSQSRRGLLDENLNLAWTQSNKNKDIPEGGSKGTILLNPTYRGLLRPIFGKYVMAVLDVILPKRVEVSEPRFADEVLAPGDSAIVDRHRQEEVLFFGPDENTADFMSWASQLAKTRGYTYWKGFTTGKSPSDGGIPHDTFGMTTISVRVYVEGIMRKLGLKPEACTKIMTGGPDGDLGCNEIKRSMEKVLGLCDGSGTIFDPAGLDKTELVRLADKRQMICHFDTSKLSKDGFLVLLADQQKKLPNGFVVEDGTTFRNRFHFNPLCKADFLVPCGGRPRAVEAPDVPLMLLPNGELKYKYIVEGANLFITEEARLMLEKLGCIIFKDAAANKGGVTSSSLEVLAGLVMPDADYQELMCLKNPTKIPEFRKAYVSEVIATVQGNAEAEFELLWAEKQKKPHMTLTELANQTSTKINSVAARLLAAADVMDFKGELGKNVLEKYHIPKVLLNKYGVDHIIKKLPPKYLEAIVACNLAAHYVYEQGLDADEIAFFNYLSKFGKF